jgi:hypothetical protein
VGALSSVLFFMFSCWLSAEILLLCGFAASNINWHSL